MMSIAPFIIFQQQMEESVREAEAEEKKRKEENQKIEDDCAGMTSCVRTYEKIPSGVCRIVEYPPQLYCNIYRLR